MTTTATPADPANTWLPVLVRLEHYTQVADYVASLEANRPSHTDDEDNDQSTSGGPTPITLLSSRTQSPAPGDLDSLGRPLWSVEDLKRLAAGHTVTTQRWTQAIDLCAQSPNLFIPSSEIAERTGMGIEEWRSAARQITRHLAKHYQQVPLWEGHPVWPLHAQSISDYPGQVSWVISPEMADLWRQARHA